MTLWSTLGQCSQVENTAEGGVRSEAGSHPAGHTQVVLCASLPASATVLAILTLECHRPLLGATVAGADSMGQLPQRTAARGQHACCSCCCFRRLPSDAWFKVNTSGYQLFHSHIVITREKQYLCPGEEEVRASQNSLSAGLQAYPGIRFTRRQLSLLVLVLSCLDVHSLWMFYLKTVLYLRPRCCLQGGTCGCDSSEIERFSSQWPVVLLILLFQLPEKFCTFNIFYLKRHFSMENISLLSGEFQI